MIYTLFNQELSMPTLVAEQLDSILVLATLSNLKITYDKKVYTSKSYIIIDINNIFRMKLEYLINSLVGICVIEMLANERYHNIARTCSVDDPSLTTLLIDFNKIICEKDRIGV